MLKFLAGLSILLLALFFQLYLAGFGIHFNIALAALIAFAFIFDFQELVILDLITVFIVNWQPALGLAIAAFAVIPLVTHFSRRIFTWQPWMGVLGAVWLGFLVFYLIAAPKLFLHTIPHFLLDAVIGSVIAELALVALE